MLLCSLLDVLTPSCQVCFPGLQMCSLQPAGVLPRPLSGVLTLACHMWPQHPSLQDFLGSLLVAPCQRLRPAALTGAVLYCIPETTALSSGACGHLESHPVCPSGPPAHVGIGQA